MDTFERLVAEAWARPFQGWDFRFLDGRYVEGRTSWDYPKLLRTKMAGSGAYLDLGTGGGEIVSAAAPPPPSAGGDRMLPARPAGGVREAFPARSGRRVIILQRQHSLGGADAEIRSEGSFEVTTARFYLVAGKREGSPSQH